MSELEYDAVPLRDQRSMTGPGFRQTAAEIEAAWEDWGRRQGWLHRPGQTELLRMPNDQTVGAYINEGRWIATCPACNGGMAAWPAHDKVWCSDCGRVWKAAFPALAVIQQAEDVLLCRPPVNRHWFPATESVDDLKVENVTRGYPMRAR